MSIRSSRYNPLRWVWEEYIAPIVDLVFVPSCAVCGKELAHTSQHICTACMLDAPLTYYWRDERSNPMAERMQNIRPEIVHAAAFIFYIHNSRWRDLIHRFKYNTEYRHGLRLGRWMGTELREGEAYHDIEAVVAVPLHPLRRLKRGYNQSEMLAEGIAQALSCKVIYRGIRRTRHNSAQATTQRTERWANVENLFKVIDPTQFADRDVLLVDDVFTTGATITSCAEAILDAAPTCRLRIATFAVSNHEFGFAQR
ncbi:MAG: phosphoribosyltransferase family protein [Rikenellaceae bacterium]